MMIRTLAVVLMMLPLSSCLAGAVIGAAVDVTGAVVGTTVKTTGAVIGAAIPDGDDEDDDDDRFRK
ncbi:MAG: NF038104 family lipoprotein [Phycisphaerales bacterium]|nr:NF038104 family lipoprotein [Hyphomonadaceae bacterium]